MTSLTGVWVNNLLKKRTIRLTMILYFGGKDQHHAKIFKKLTFLSFSVCFLQSNVNDMFLDARWNNRYLQFFYRWFICVHATYNIIKFLVFGFEKFTVSKFNIFLQLYLKSWKYESIFLLKNARIFYLTFSFGVLLSNLNVKVNSLDPVLFFWKVFFMF